MLTHNNIDRTHDCIRGEKCPRINHLDCVMEETFKFLIWILCCVEGPRVLN